MWRGWDPHTHYNKIQATNNFSTLSGWGCLPVPHERSLQCGQNEKRVGSPLPLLPSIHWSLEWNIDNSWIVFSVSHHLPNYRNPNLTPAWGLHILHSNLTHRCVAFPSCNTHHHQLSATNSTQFNFLASCCCKQLCHIGGGHKEQSKARVFGAWTL